MDTLTLKQHLVKAAKAELWRRRKVWPLLRFYLDAHQLEDIRAFFGTADAEKGELPKDSWYDEISRQRGKSYKWCVLAVVWCHCHPKQFVKYAAQLGKSVRRIIWPTIKALVADMPSDAQGRGETPKQDAEKVREDRTDHTWHFPNGSELLAAGVNLDHEDDLRGSKAHIFIKDECAFYTNFPKVEQVSNPQMLTTRGVSVYATTPPESPSHPVRMVRDGLKAIGRYVFRTIYGHPRLSEQEIEDHLQQQANSRGQTISDFKKSTFFRREYLCLWVAEETRAVIPEWSAVYDDENPERGTWGDFLVVDDYKRPEFYLPVDTVDLGFTRDPSAYLGGFWDYDAACLVIERESPSLYRHRTDALAMVVRELRQTLWPGNLREPYHGARRYKDNSYWDPIVAVGDAGGNGAELLAELAKEYDMHFVHAEKLTVEAMANGLGKLVRAGKLRIHRRCTNIIKQLSQGLWADKETKVDFERTTEGHLDHLAALIYLVRHLPREHNPYPPHWGVDLANTIVHEGSVNTSQNAVKKIFG